MKMNKTTRFVLDKLVAIATIVIGIHIVVAYCAKSLPFGIQSELLMAVWAPYGIGCLIDLSVIVIGLYHLFEEYVEYFVDELMWQKGLRRTRKGSR